MLSGNTGMTDTKPGKKTVVPNVKLASVDLGGPAMFTRGFVLGTFNKLHIEGLLGTALLPTVRVAP